MLTTANEKLIHAYLEIVTTDDYENFGTLLTDDCTFSLMPSGHTFRGHKDIMAFVEIAGGSRTHDKHSKVVIKNWFTDGHYLCVEYDHTAIVQALHYRVKIDGYCWVFHMRDGKFDEIREVHQPLTTLNELCYGLRPKTPPARRQVKSTAEVTPQHVAGNK